MANILLMIVIACAALFIASIIIGLFYLVIVWFIFNRHIPWPLSSYFSWVNQKKYDIRARAEIKRINDEWKEMNEKKRREA